ncbi:hypothetical protein CC79DRAFT_1335140 [Sarocladium strictum]
MKFQSLVTLAAMVAPIAAAPQGADRAHDRINLKETTAMRLGDGSPRQAYLYKQISSPVQCGGSGQTCGSSFTDMESFAVSATFGVTLGFLSPSLGVSWTYGTSTTASCNGGADKTASTVCVWERIAHTGWEVQDWSHRSGQPPEKGSLVEKDPYYVWTPNTNKGHGMVCAHDDECQSVGDEWWGYMSKGDRLWSAVSNKGGPQDFVWGSDPDNRWN